LRVKNIPRTIQSMESRSPWWAKLYATMGVSMSAAVT
jgi:hypothetical protein